MDNTMNKRIFNFSAGPATLPPAVLQQAQQDIINFRDSGMGIMEISHRSQLFITICNEIIDDIRQLLAIPAAYRILFLQGGASSQFFMVPANLLAKGRKATYLNTGIWSNKAIKEARLYGDISVGFTSEQQKFNRVPLPGEFSVAADAEYLYYTSNNTISGTQFHYTPKADIPLICDMSSDILSRPIEIERYGLIFAGAQKNIGTAGVTLVIIREDLLDKAPENLPTMLQYRTHANSDSLFNTPPTFAIYIMGEMLKWIKNQGGVAAIQQANQEKAALLYRAIDQSDSYYRGHADRDSRSQMNVSFTLANPELEQKFLQQALAAGFSGLKGHRLLGGCRASIYNAFAREGVEKLIAFMQQFQQANPV